MSLRGSLATVTGLAVLLGGLPVSVLCPADVGVTALPEARAAVVNTPDMEAWVTDGWVSAIARGADGITYVGGSFSHVGPNTGGFAAIDATSGERDGRFPRVDGSVYKAVPDGAGGWFIGGKFRRVGDQTRKNIAHILANGGVDAYWDPAANYTVFDIVVSGSLVYVGGEFTSIGGQPRNRIAALNAGTGLATNWDPNANRWVHCLAVRGTTVYAGGDFTSIGGQTRSRIAALDTATGLATGWDPNASGSVVTLAVSGATVYTGGSFTSIGGQTRNRIAGLDAATGLATGWDPNASNSVLTLAVSDSTVYAGGYFTSIGGQARNGIAALDAATGLATTWRPSPSAPSGANIRALAVSGSTVYAGGFFTSIGGQTRRNLAALDVGTGLATAWNPNVNDFVAALAVSGSTVCAGGGFSSVGGQDRSCLAAFNARGQATSWNPNANGVVRALTIAGTTLYAGGSFTQVGGQDRNNIAALEAVTGAVTAWDPDANGSVLALAAAGTTVYAGGEFTTIGGQSRKLVAGLDTATGAATAWNAGAECPFGKTCGVEALAVSGATVYAGGSFYSVGGESRYGIAALDAATGAVRTWHPNPNHPSSAVSIQALAASGSTIYVGGTFSVIGGQPRSNLAALDAATGLATAWSPSMSWRVRSIAVSGSTVYAGNTHVHALDAATGNRLWSASTNSEVLALAVSPSAVYAGGAFDVINSAAPRKGFARFPSEETRSSVGAHDGWALESGETTGRAGTINAKATTLRLGDDRLRRQYRALLSFSTGGLPDNAVVVRTTLKVRRAGVVGRADPVRTLRGFMVDVKRGRFGKGGRLEIGDFNAPASRTFGPFVATPDGGWYTLELPRAANALVNTLATNGGLTQFRLRFRLDDNNNAVANILSLFSANAPLAARPQLVVEYVTP